VTEYYHRDLLARREQREENPTPQASPEQPEEKITLSGSMIAGRIVAGQVERRLVAFLHSTGLKYDVDVSKGLLQCLITFTVRGPKDEIDDIEESLEDWSRRIQR